MWLNLPHYTHTHSQTLAHYTTHSWCEPGHTLFKHLDWKQKLASISRDWVRCYPFYSVVERFIVYVRGRHWHSRVTQGCPPLVCLSIYEAMVIKVILRAVSQVKVKRMCQRERMISIMTLIQCSYVKYGKHISHHTRRHAHTHWLHIVLCSIYGLIPNFTCYY